MEERRTLTDHQLVDLMDLIILAHRDDLPRERPDNPQFVSATITFVDALLRHSAAKAHAWVLYLWNCHGVMLPLAAVGRAQDAWRCYTPGREEMQRAHAGVRFDIDSVRVEREFNLTDPARVRMLAKLRRP